MVQYGTVWYNAPVRGPVRIGTAQSSIKKRPDLLVGPVQNHVCTFYLLFRIPDSIVIYDTVLYGSFVVIIWYLAICCYQIPFTLLQMVYILLRLLAFQFGF